MLYFTDYFYSDMPLLVSAELSKENPYEDIELESQCSQQSLPSSPGADTSKVYEING